MSLIIALSVLLLGITAVCLNRLRPAPRNQPHKSRFGFYPIAAANAIQTIQAIVHPQAQHVISSLCDERSDEDDASDPNDPIQHLHRQAAKIRRGQPIDRLTARLPRPPRGPLPPS